MTIQRLAVLNICATINTKQVGDTQLGPGGLEGKGLLDRINGSVIGFISEIHLAAKTSLNASAQG